jgi:DNA-binding beta-propeller fold protein YncE
MPCPFSRRFFERQPAGRANQPLNPWNAGLPSVTCYGGSQSSIRGRSCRPIKTSEGRRLPLPLQVGVNTRVRGRSMRPALRSGLALLLLTVGMTVTREGAARPAMAAYDCPFASAIDVAYDSRFNQLFLTTGTSVVRVSIRGTVLSTWPAPGAGGIAVDGRGMVYVLEGNNIEILSPARGVFVRYGGGGQRSEQLRHPLGIAVDALGTTVYVADYGNARVQKLTRGGKKVMDWAPRGNRMFFQPGGIALDRRGNVYEIDGQDSWVNKLSSTGKPLAELGSFQNPTQGQFLGPSAVAVDGHGNVFVADYNFVAKLAPSGRRLATWGTLRPGHRRGLFYLPSSLATDGSGHVYVVDAGNHRVQKLTASGRSLASWTCGSHTKEIRDVKRQCGDGS